MRRAAGLLVLLSALLLPADLGVLRSVAESRDMPSVRAPAENGEQQAGPELQASDIARLWWHPAIGGPSFLGTKEIEPPALGLSEHEAQDVKRLAQAFLRTYGPQLQAVEPGIEWTPLRVGAVPPRFADVFLGQTYQGLRVFGGQLAVHMKDAAVTAANGEFLTSIRVSIKPAVTLPSAHKAAAARLSLASPSLAVSELLIYNPALLDLGPSVNYLAYRLVLADGQAAESHTVFVDAHTGKILLSFSNLQEGKNRDIRDLNGSTSLPGTQCYSESGPTGTPSADCVNAFTFTGDTYDYFLNTHGRDSFNGSGATMLASVRYGTEANAFWDGAQTAFGPGFATKDVVGHEWTHAVTQYTADLTYAYQSGALNESLSDIFGAMIDREDWLMGEDTPIGTIRSLADPTVFGDPGKVSDSQYYCGSGDNGGVHSNSGVPNHTAYLMAEGGTYNGRTVTGIGRGPTELIFYRALTTYLTSGSSFNDAYNALISSATDLYGGGSATVTSVTTAAQATEMDQAACGAVPAVPDSFEPDDIASQASTITVNGSSQSHNFHVAGDNDWGKFTAVTGTSYVIETFDLGSGSDTYLYLYDTNGTTVIAQDDDSGGSYASRIAWTASTAGTYYARLRHYSSGSSGASTYYSLRVTGTGGSTGADSYEADDSAAQASTITPDGGPQTHNFHVAGDNDWAKFTATAGTSYLIETLNLGSGSDTVLYLYSTDGSTLITSNDDGGTGSASRVEWTASSGGTYYVRVHHHSATTYGPNTNYDMRVTSAGTPADSYEPDNTPSQASTITPGSTQSSHNFHVAGDADWAKFSAVASTAYVIDTLNLGSLNDTYLELYSTDGSTLIAANDDTGGTSASRIDWTATANGTYYVRVRHYDSTTYGANTSYDLRVSGTATCSGGDSFEPDDSASQASTITVNGGAQSHNFYCAGDNDWFKFGATLGVDYVIETLNLGSGNDTYLYLYGTDGSTIITQDDDSGSRLASRIAWSATGTGTYYVRVRHYSATASGSTNTYDLRVTGTGSGGSADAYEDDDVAARATTISSTQANHNFHDDGDHDWAKFAATAATSYIIETLNLGSRSDTYLDLYGTDGSTLITSDDDSGGAKASRIGWSAPASGTYYVRVRHYISSVYGANSNYDLRLRTIGASGDANEPDDTSAQASTITVDGSVQTHTFHVAGDNDWAKFAATAGVAYTIQTLNLGPTSDTYLYLYGTDATTLIASNDDGGGGLASRVTWTPTSSGTYFVKVRHYSSSVFGTTTNYDLQVLSSGGSGDAYEPDNTAAQATTIAAGTPQTNHTVHFAGDNDWAKFTASAGTNYVIDTLNLGVRSDTYLYLYSSDGTTEIATDDDGGSGLASRISWTAPANGTYYLRVRHFSSSVYGSDTNYDLRVTNAGCGAGDSYEPDNTASQANPITVDGSSQSHTFYCAGDNDWVLFSATVGSRYVIETLNLGSSTDTYLYLYGTDGSTVITDDDDGGTGLGSRIEWTAPASGTYYVRARHYSSTASGSAMTYDLRVAGVSSGADAYEPDDSAIQASTIGTTLASGVAGTQANHNSHAASDSDWAKFAATSGDTCTMETLNLGSRSDTVLYLYGTDGSTLITSNDDGGSGLASRIVWTASTSGTYYLKARHFSASTYGANTNYDLRVTCTSAGTDAYEPDNAYAQAVTITVGTTQSGHNFHLAGDNDWGMFAAMPGIRYIVQTLNLGSRGDTYLYLYGTDGTTLIASDDDSGGGLASRIQWSAPVTGTYYIRARHFSSSAYGPDTRYDLRLTTTSAAAAPAATAELTVGAARVGGNVAATVYARGAAAAIKVETLAKPSYLRLEESIPLSRAGKSLSGAVTTDQDRWQMATESSGRTSVWYAGKPDWQGEEPYPVLELRWRLTGRLPSGKLTLPVHVTVVDQNGLATSEEIELTIVMLGAAPKIDIVQPASIPNASDTILTLQGSDFQNTPKLALQAGSNEFSLHDVTFISPNLLRGTVPAGTKAGTYKVWLVNPDSSSAQFAGDVTVSPQYRYYFPLAFKGYAGGW